MRGLCSAHRRVRPRLLLPVFAIVSAPGGPRSQSWAQDTCGVTSATPLRVDSLVGARALDTAVNCADGGTVEAVWAGVVTLDAPISIGSRAFLSITGEGNLAEVQGDSQVRLFDVSPSGGLSLADLSLSRGFAARGGAIHSTSGTVTLDGCVFESNDATTVDGGAVWAEGGDLTIVGGEVLGNSADRKGGAVLVVDGAQVIQDGTRFEENRAMLEGGALYCGGTPNSTRTAAASCSLSEAVSRSNNASLEADIVHPIKFGCLPTRSTGEAGLRFGLWTSTSRNQCSSSTTLSWLAGRFLEETLPRLQSMSALSRTTLQWDTGERWLLHRE